MDKKKKSKKTTTDSTDQYYHNNHVYHDTDIYEHIRLSDNKKFISFLKE